MTWPAFPKRLQAALKALCFLTHAHGPVQTPKIADHIGVSRAETAKVLQLLVWGGFVKSRRGNKGGFELAVSEGRITTGNVIDFFHARHPAEPDTSSPVMRALQQRMAPCQKAFGELTLAEVAGSPVSKKRRARASNKGHKRNSAMQKGTPAAR